MEMLPMRLLGQGPRRRLQLGALTASAARRRRLPPLAEAAAAARRGISGRSPPPLLRAAAVAVAVQRRSCAAVPAAPSTASAAEPVNEPSVGSEDHLLEVFQCQGIDHIAVQLRRLVQLGMGIEFVGTQVANLSLLANSDPMAHFGTSFFFENSNALVGLHIYVVWRYAGFLRDALLARHVTRIALASPDAELLLLGRNPTGQVSSGGAAADPDKEDRPSKAPVDDDKSCMQTVELIIETGPFQRRLKLAPMLNVADVEAGDTEHATLGQLFRSGMLHVDQQEGHVFQDETLAALLSDRWRVVSEEVATDVSAANRAFLDLAKLAGFLADGADGAALKAVLEKWYLRPMLQLSGGPVLQWFGRGALAMGVGSAFVWCYPRFSGSQATARA